MLEWFSMFSLESFLDIGGNFMSFSMPFLPSPKKPKEGGGKGRGKGRSSHQWVAYSLAIQPGVGLFTIKTIQTCRWWLNCSGLNGLCEVAGVVSFWHTVGFILDDVSCKDGLYDRVRCASMKFVVFFRWRVGWLHDKSHPTRCIEHKPWVWRQFYRFSKIFSPTAKPKSHPGFVKAVFVGGNCAPLRWLWNPICPTSGFCDEVLLEEPGNVKALYRKADALGQLLQTDCYRQKGS